MVATIFGQFKLIIGLMLLCTFIHISSSRPAFIDDDISLVQPDNAFIHNYVPTNEPLHNDIPYDDSYYPNKLANHDTMHMAKRIIMLPRVGRRSFQST
ncbi:unnamed protein product [Rotaria magnacalcarata]|uniref:Melanin-concentrating hormone n=1 Tax=Rotaria magnacalcarata TaxID=392030 RepID=A0A816EWU8_9BILA|nr:unnamed protein product [Rotaria magnacalcarata]CAF1651394.1 unnamed protein product [Rotaria magnacalcarata]CAF2056648.1 unnamed protein product [Rotaria magnacalcarata]CAF2216406.1 unnamed protein product [Rotaria magnacalcarata]CAF3861848.1 unnamed protein product [Rotaria magnacalcarata]